MPHLDKAAEIAKRHDVLRTCPNCGGDWFVTADDVRSWLEGRPSRCALCDTPHILALPCTPPELSR